MFKNIFEEEPLQLDGQMAAGSGEHGANSQRAEVQEFLLYTFW